MCVCMNTHTLRVSATLRRTKQAHLSFVYLALFSCCTAPVSAYLSVGGRGALKKKQLYRLCMPCFNLDDQMWHDGLISFIATGNTSGDN